MTRVLRGGRYRLDDDGPLVAGTVRPIRHQTLDVPLRLRLFHAATGDADLAAARKLVALAHPHLHPVTDVLEVDGLVGLVGAPSNPATTLALHMERDALPARAVLAVGAMLIGVLDHLHAAGLAHGALTAESVLVVDEGLTVMLADAALPPRVSAASRRRDLDALRALLARLVCGDGDLEHRLAAFAGIGERAVEAASLVLTDTPGPAWADAWEAATRTRLRHDEETPVVAPTRGSVDTTPPEATTSHSLELLDAPLTRFVGRREELALLARHLVQRRLVVVVGPGGIGKSALVRAFTASAPATSAFTEICWVDLATVAGPDDAIARLLGSGSLGQRHGLVVLEDADGIGPALFDVVRRVLANQGARVLAVARRPTGIHGERRLMLGPLTPSDGFALFTEYARATAPGRLAMRGADALVEELVRALDGDPFALECAAARLRTRSVPEVLDDVRAGHPLPAPEGTAARYPSFRDAVRSNVALAPPASVDAFRAMPLFQGPFTFNAYEAVLHDRQGEALRHALFAGVVRQRPAHRFAVSAGYRLHGAGAPAPAHLSRYTDYFLALGSDATDADRADVLAAVRAAIDTQRVADAARAVCDAWEALRTGPAEPLLASIDALLLSPRADAHRPALLRCAAALHRAAGRSDDATLLADEAARLDARRA